MIWAELQRGMLATNYTPDMIQLPESSEPRHQKGKSKPGDEGEHSSGNSPSRSKASKKHRPAPVQRAITPARLGHSIVIAKPADGDFGIPSSRPASRAGPFRSPTPSGGRISPDDGWWLLNVPASARQLADRPKSCEVPARNRHRMSPPAAALPPMGLQTWSTPRTTSRNGRRNQMPATWASPRTSPMLRSSMEPSASPQPIVVVQDATRDGLLEGDATLLPEDLQGMNSANQPDSSEKRDESSASPPRRSHDVQDGSLSPTRQRFQSAVRDHTNQKQKVLQKVLDGFGGKHPQKLTGPRDKVETQAGAEADGRSAAKGGNAANANIFVTRPKSKLAATLERLRQPQVKAQGAPGAVGVAPGAGGAHHGAKRTDAAPEESKMLAATIKRVVCGDNELDGDGEKRLPVDRQTTYASDELSAGGRELTGHEREKIATVFREMAKNANAAGPPLTERPGDKAEKGKEGKEGEKDGKQQEDAVRSHGMLVIPWVEVQKRLRGRLSSAHIQRLGVYFGLKGRVRIGLYLERIGYLITSTPEKRLRIAFGLLDVGGDSVIGRRDIFAALASTRIDEGSSGDTQDVVFTSLGLFGIDFADSDTSSLEVIGVAAASPAEMQGVKIGSRLSQVNGIAVEDLTAAEVRMLLLNPARPLALTLRCRPEQNTHLQLGGSPTGMFEMSDLNKLLRTLGSDVTSSRVKIQVVSAKNLRNADSHAGKSDPYCQVEIPNKPHTRWQTRTIYDCLDPVWQEEREIPDFATGETIKFTVRDKDFGMKDGEFLGSAVLGKKLLSAVQNGEGSFEGDLPLTEVNAQKTNSTLRVKVSFNGEGGIGLAAFEKLFADGEPAFLAPLQEMLTGLSRKKKVEEIQAVKIRVTMVSASGLRNADMGGKSDPYCTCEIAQRTRPQKVQTKTINDTLDPVWNDRRDISDYLPGEALRFAVWDSDPGKSAINDDLLGQVIVSSVQFWPGGYEGELPLLDGGKNFSPMLKIKIATPASMAPPKEAGKGQQPEKEQTASKPEAQIAALHEAQLRHEADVKELKLRLPHLNEDVFAWHLHVFEALCDEDRLIRRGRFVASADRLFGVPVGRLTAKFFDAVSPKNMPIGVLDWSQQMEQFRGEGWEQSQARVALAFELYDLDGDGILSVQDAVGLSREVDRLKQMYGDESEQKPVCEEMRWLYGLVANTTDGTGQGSTLDLHAFKQVRPDPLLTKELMQRLNILAEETERIQNKQSVVRPKHLDSE
eukprot:TRINITY_DN13465_c0_g1_i1.p1 TRINITY_DN13465_c0_g1~~TRINITY_DN13465_c0_g1_i1.p1  ORF type:complete len:1234 (+),score=274.20 TRINITY_DN13465_c0_g1_i1:132-3833(+)